MTLNLTDIVKHNAKTVSPFPDFIGGGFGSKSVFNNKQPKLALKYQNRLRRKQN